MYCIILYLDNSSNELDQPLSEDVSIIHPRPTIVPNKQENKELLVNPNCPTQIVLEYICKKTGVNNFMEYDLCNVETGEMLNIKKTNQWNYANSVMVPKQTYVFVFPEKDQFGEFKGYEPYLCKQTKLYTDVFNRINKKPSITKKSPPPKAVKRRNRKPSSTSIGSTEFDVTKSYLSDKL